MRRWSTNLPKSILTAFALPGAKEGGSRPGLRKCDIRRAKLYNMLRRSFLRTCESINLSGLSHTLGDIPARVGGGKKLRDDLFMKEVSSTSSELGSETPFSDDSALSGLPRREVAVSERLPEEFVVNTLLPHMDRLITRFIVAHTPAMLTQLVECYATYTHYRTSGQNTGPIIERLMDTIKYRMPGYQSSDIVSSLPACFALAADDEELFSMFMDRIEDLKWTSFTPLQLLGILRIYSKLPHFVKTVHESIVPAVVESVKKLDGHELKDVIVALGSAAGSDRSLAGDVHALMAILPEIEKRVVYGLQTTSTTATQVQSREVKSVAQGGSSLRTTESSNTSQDEHACTSHCSHQQLSVTSAIPILDQIDILWALVRLQIRHQALISAVADTLPEIINDLPVKYICRLAWIFAHTESPNLQSTLDIMISAISESSVLLLPGEVSRLVSCLGAPGFAALRGVLEDATDRLVEELKVGQGTAEVSQPVSHLSAERRRDIAFLLFSVSRLTSSPSVLLLSHEEYLVELINKASDQFTEPEIRRIVGTCTTAGLSVPKKWRLIADAVKAKLDEQTIS